jgi:hypothetical protein
VGGEEGGDQERGGEVEVQDEEGHRHCGGERGQEGQGAELQGLGRVVTRHVQIDLQPGHEHDVDEADVAQEVHHRLPGHELDAARPQHGAQDQQPQEPRQTGLLHGELGRERGQDQDRELEDRVFDGKHEPRVP